MVIIPVPVAIYRTGRKQRAIVVNSLTLILPSQISCPVIIADFITRDVDGWNPFHPTSQSIPAQYCFGLECHPDMMPSGIWLRINRNYLQLTHLGTLISLGNIQGATLPLQAIGPIRSSAEQQRIARSLVVFRSSSSPLVSIQPFH